jgi:lipopolysaccharide/colanic/teichoic acid biosynthesis glycosyltransferase
MYKAYLKRIFDFLAAFFGFLLLSPIFIIVTIGLYFANHGKPFFFQIRPGKGEQLFRIVKFKTMNDIREEKYALFFSKIYINNRFVIDYLCKKHYFYNFN